MSTYFYVEKHFVNIGQRKYNLLSRTMLLRWRIDGVRTRRDPWHRTIIWFYLLSPYFLNYKDLIFRLTNYHCVPSLSSSPGPKFEFDTMNDGRPQSGSNGVT